MENQGQRRRLKLYRKAQERKRYRLIMAGLLYCMNMLKARQQNIGHL